VTYSQLRRWLAAQGVAFVEGGKHTKLYFQGRQSTLPRHGSREISEGTRRAILKQLGLKE
jgi:mRNA interferase HicA